MEMERQHMKGTVPLPLSSLRLLVPPLRLVSAALWQVVMRRRVSGYGVVEEFVTTVFDTVPDMMTSREKVQLIMGLRAQLVLEWCRSDHQQDPDSIQQHLNKLKTSIMTYGDKNCDPEVKASESNFLKLIETLQKDPVEKEHFFQKVFPEKFGRKYHSALQTMVWDFLSKLENLLPTPSLQQTASWLLPDPCVLEECVQSVIQPEPLQVLLRYHTNHIPASHVESNALSSENNPVLSPLSLALLETMEVFPDQQIQHKQTQGFMTIQSPASSDIESETTPLLDFRETEQKNEMLPLNELESDFVECLNQEVTARNLNDGTPDKESTQDKNMHEAPSHSDNGMNIQAVACSQQEVEDISQISTYDWLYQPRVLLQKLDISDMLLPESEFLLNDGFHGQRGGQVLLQKSRNVDAELSDSQPVCSLVSDATDNHGPIQRSKRVKICSFCGKGFKEAKDLTRHVRSHTEQEPFSGILGGQHLESHENFQECQENVCELEVQPEEDNMSTTSEEDWRETDNNTIDRTRHLRSPFSAEQGPYKTNKCSLCDKTFRWLKELKEHTKYKHDRVLCLVCCGVFERSNFDQHKGCLKRLACTLCGDMYKHSERVLCEDPNPQQQPSKDLPVASTLSDAVEHVSTIQPPTNCTQQNQELRLVNDFRTCLLCNEYFANREDMRLHLKLHHCVLPYLCFKCGESFQRPSDLEKHSYECSGRNIPSSRQCPRCRVKSYTHQQEMTRQEETLVRPEPEQQLCAGDKEAEIPQFSSTNVDISNDSYEHPPISHSNLIERGFLFNQQTTFAGTRLELNLQRGQASGEDITSSKPPREVDPEVGCSSQASRESETEILQPHSSESSVGTAPTLPPGVDLDCRTCHLCSKSFRLRASLTMHLRRHGEGEGVMKCPICSKNFACNKEVIGHLANKKGCGRLLRNKTAVIAPIGYKVVTCPECLQQFTSDNKLKCHMACHRGEGFSCCFCGRMFFKSSQLDAHMRSHTHRPYLCDTCGKDFTSENNLEVHKYVHTNERPYTCSTCGRKFKLKGTLKSHRMVHTGERPFACSLCQVRCLTNRHLKLHILRHHTKERPFKCRGCGKGYVQKGDLNRHLAVKPSCLMAQS
ncbi:hypothetical protein DPEC_G00118070 [Dallia pectoralis]|uniref:Uncharacterized protein n=1 Tax=Dallia pectoralis TaxID=75939 RepID=A0ACC2GVZ6_DALPE|nr:hypothetical protein DPEC_G00118070 [Dallia pectoralis]